MLNMPLRELNIALDVIYCFRYNCIVFFALKMCVWNCHFKGLIKCFEFKIKKY